MFDLLKPFLARIAGSLAAGLATWLAAKNVPLKPDDVAALSGAFVTVAYVVYSFVHILVDKKLGSGASK